MTDALITPACDWQIVVYLNHQELRSLASA